jgi:hypothetical protein
MPTEDAARRTLLPGAGRRELGPTPLAEDQAAEGEPEAERSEREGAERGDLARAPEALPASNCLFLLARQRLAAPLLAERAARSQAEIEVVEDLGGLIDHDLSV